MKLNYSVLCLVVVAFLSTSRASDQDAEKVEESTKSPIEEQMQVTEVEMKTSTDRPSTSSTTEMSKNTQKEPQSPEHTVAKYIFHPLIALKTRTAADDISIGKQATTSTSSSPWTIFGFNPGQSFGSLAGSVSGWINGRIPSFVDTPVRDTSITTTPRPEVHPTYSPNRQRPNRLDYPEVEGDDYDDDESFEYEGDDEGQEIDYPAHNRIRPKFGGSNEEDEGVYDEYDDEDDDFVSEIEQRPNNRLRPGQNNQNHDQQQKRRLFNLQRQQMFENKRRLQQPHPFQYDDLDENFYGEYPSMKRSQSEMGFIPHGQENLMNQFLQQRRDQVARKPQQATNQRRKPATVKGNRKEQPIEPHNSQLILPQQSVMKERDQPDMFQQPKPQRKPQPKPQPKPQTKPHPQSQSLSAQLPLKRKNRPAQYIAIPWSQLGMDPTKDHLPSFGLQAFGANSQFKPIILNIPQSAIDQIRKANQKKRPLRTEELQILPLLTEDPLENPLKPAKVQPSRKNVITTKKPIAFSMMNAPPRRVRPGTMVEKAPAEASTLNKADEFDYESSESAPNSQESIGLIRRNNRVPNFEREFIVIGDDDEPGLIRQVQPGYGNERLLQAGINPYFELLASQQKTGRALEEIVEASANHEEIQQKIPVEIVLEEKLPEQQNSQGVQQQSSES